MLILHVVAPGEIGGLERVVDTLARGQARAGYDVHIAAVFDHACANHPLLETVPAAPAGLRRAGLGPDGLGTGA